MSRKLITLPEMWREWTVGVLGCPSVEQLDRQYGPNWRSEQKERQFYSVRKAIVGELRRRAEAREGGYEVNIQAVVEEMEAERRNAGISLDRLSKALRKEKRAKE